ncbi:MAG: hypothetical protein ACYC91_20555, partial [Solirubrobacteraceae bacterium]
MRREEWVVRRLGPADRDLAKIVEQINSASMVIAEQFTQDSLNEFLADDRNVYLTVHVGGQLGVASKLVWGCGEYGVVPFWVERLAVDLDGVHLLVGDLELGG